jgi:hypothetical protein
MDSDDQMWQPPTLGLATTGIAQPMTANGQTAICDPWPWPPAWQYAPPFYQPWPVCTCPSVWLGTVPPPPCPVHATSYPVVGLTADDIERIARRVVELLEPRKAAPAQAAAIDDEDDGA